MGERKTQELRVFYYDEDRSPDVVVVGGWELVEMQRKYRGVDLEGQIEPTYYLAYLGARRSGLSPGNFEEWGKTVAIVEEVDEPGESQAPPAT